MLVTSEQFRDALSKLDNGDELLEFHTAAVAAEKSKGIEISRSKNHENQRMKAFKTAFEKLGFDKDESELEAYVDEMIAKIEGKETQENGKLGELQKTLAKLQKDFEKTQKELGTEREQRTTLQQQNRLKTIESKLLPKLQEDFYGANFIVKALIADGAVDLDDTGEVIFKKGDAVIPLADGLKSIAESNADSRKNKQTGGAGSAGSTVQTKGPKFTMDQIKSMTPEQMKTNLADVNESMRALMPAK